MRNEKYGTMIVSSAAYFLSEMANDYYSFDIFSRAGFHHLNEKCFLFLSLKGEYQ